MSMDVYITNLETNEMLQLPMLPEEIKGKIANSFASYSILKNGEVKIPTGTALDTYSWSGQFPGSHRKEDPYITKWKAPKKCDKFLRSLKASNGKPVKARLLVTETNINLDVYMQDYSPTESGGYGDITYSVTFVRAKSLLVKKSAKANVKSKSKAEKRKTTAKKKTYTVKKGDCLWAIAEKYYGNGKLYTKIRDANKAVISKHGSDPNMIWPGDVLVIP